MGAGASAAAEANLSEAERAKLSELKAMSPEAQQELAFNAMKDTLNAAVQHAITKGSTVETWTSDIYKIPCPKVGDFQDIAESVGKIPLVGKGLATAVMAPVDSVLASFADCGKSIFESPALALGLTSIVNDIDGATAINLAQSGGFAYSEYMIVQSSEKLSTTMQSVVSEILKTHAITTVWATAITAYNAAASKIPGIEELTFDLSDYVVSQSFATLGSLIFEKESSIRGGNVENCSDSIKKIYGSSQPSVEEQIKPVVLVKKGDPRAICFQEPLPTVVDSKTALDPTTKGVQLISKGGLILVQKWSKSQQIGTESFWNQIGIGQPGQISEDGTTGRPMEFIKYENFLVSRLTGEGRDNNVYAMDLANARYFEGNGIGLMSSSDMNPKRVLRSKGGRDWKFNADGTISPNKSGWNSAGDYVLGVKLVKDGVGFSVGGGSTY